MKKILIVEDDQIVANIYRNKLTVEGYQVQVASDGESGLKVVGEWKPDALVLDLMLPRMNGVEVMRRLREEGNMVPIVVFSNTYLTSMVQEAWKAGATKCLSKSNCSPRQVVEVVTSVVGGGRQGGGGDGYPGQTGTSGTAVLTAPAAVVAPAVKGSDGMSTDGDAEFQAELRTSFIESLPGTLASLRSMMQGLIKADTDAARLRQLQEIYRKVHGVTGSAGITGMTQVAQMADALEALLKELHEKPKNLNASTMRTVASAIDFLGLLFEQKVIPNREELPAPTVLVVDDEVISRRAVTYALDKAKLKSVSVEDPESAYKLLTENRFDMVFLDVDMPGMNGFELCARLRGLANHKTTPVIFVTSLNDFDNRTQSMMSGGNDFIGKPFLFIELAVKALIYVLKRRMTG